MEILVRKKGEGKGKWTKVKEQRWNLSSDYPMSATQKILQCDPEGHRVPKCKWPTWWRYSVHKLKTLLLCLGSYPLKLEQ